MKPETGNLPKKFGQYFLNNKKEKTANGKG